MPLYGQSPCGNEFLKLEDWPNLTYFASIGCRLNSFIRSNKYR
jgi:hypothetical protein